MQIQQIENKRFISEIENDLKVLLNSKRGIEEAKQFKQLLNELSFYMEYVTTEYLKNFIVDKKSQRWILRDFLNKSNLITIEVLGQLKQEWRVTKWTTEIKNYLLSGKELLNEPKKIVICKAYTKFIQDTYHKIVERENALIIA